jgi:hypothetical protein
MIFKRAIEENLETWRRNPNRKPLIISGARQVGKTTLIKEFAKSYSYQIVLNLEREQDADIFRHNMDVRSIVESLFLSANIPISAIGETLLFIDEIQESPSAIQMLRYFSEDHPRLNVIAAGSLLEFAMKRVKSFPGGRVEFLYMHPLNFIEYLEAVNHMPALEQLKKVPVEPYAHSVLLTLFNKYVIIGGMPEITGDYLETGSMTELPAVYEGIWVTYSGDVEKYASNDTERKLMKHIMVTAPHYVDQRIRFQNFGQSNYRSREAGEAFRNLNDAKIIRLVYPTTDVDVPVKTDLRKSPRLQFLDTGLVNYKLGIQAGMISFPDLSHSYKGSIIPHVIMQELISLNKINDNNPHFWVREKKQSSAEVDMVFTYHDKVIPVEIKSGKEGTLRSLHQFMELCDHPYAVRMYAGKFGIIKTKTVGGKHFLLMNMPYYLGTMLPDYIAYFVENNKLAQA